MCGGALQLALVLCGALADGWPPATAVLAAAPVPVEPAAACAAVSRFPAGSGRFFPGSDAPADHNKQCAADTFDGYYAGPGVLGAPAAAPSIGACCCRCANTTGCAVPPGAAAGGDGLTFTGLTQSLGQL
jgi:hypothetical protein